MRADMSFPTWDLHETCSGTPGRPEDGPRLTSAGAPAKVPANNKDRRTGRELMLCRLASIAAMIVAALAQSAPAAAEASTLRAAKQYGLGYVQYMLMEDQKLVEK